MVEQENSFYQAKERAKGYGFLASVYLKSPTPILLEELKKQGLTDEEENVEMLVKEFNNLFVVPLGQYTTPYEAVYLDEREIAGKKVRGLLMGPSTLDVVQRYKKAGAKMVEGIGELPDHIGVELAFMEFLCEREAEARRENDINELKEILDSEVGFLNDHLLKWVPLLVQKIHNKTRTNLYKRLAVLTKETVTEDLNFLERSSCHVQDS